MRASLIIASYNEGERLWKTIQACHAACAGLDHELLIADDASFDGSVEEALRRFPRVQLIRHEVRQGASPTKALGAKHARGDVFVFLDGHCNPAQDAIWRLVKDVEELKGEAIITPSVPALDIKLWRNSLEQTGHGYRLELERFECGWLPLNDLRITSCKGRMYYESPALIGCALAISRELYDDLWGFDPHMFTWGVEDLDLGMKCWLMGHSILHDPEAVVGHRFRKSFDNYEVPLERLIVNQLRMARKQFTRGVWSEWVECCRKLHTTRLAEHPEGLWARIWSLFEEHQASVEQERTYLLGHRLRDEFWYADRFRLSWPRLETSRISARPAEQPHQLLQPSPSPGPCDVAQVTPREITICTNTDKTFRALNADGKEQKDAKWDTGGAGDPQSGKGRAFLTKFAEPGVYTVTAKCNETSASATVNVVEVSFSVGQVKTGITEPLPSKVCKDNNENITIETTVVATVNPKSAADSVRIIEEQKSTRFEITSRTVDTEKGTITIVLKGRSMTPTDQPDGDAYLQATANRKVCASVPVIVVVPYQLTPVSAGPTIVDGQNDKSTNCTVPAYFPKLDEDEVYLDTFYGITQDIQVQDQFGDPLDAMYDNAPVFENPGGGDETWYPINVKVTGGSYSDIVGWPEPRPGGAKVLKTSPEAEGWLEADPTPLSKNHEGITQTIDVNIAGVQLETGVANRNVDVKKIAGQPTQAEVTITWD